jgi:hypothetical protein
MVIIYDCELTEPPSSVSCFRDVTLYSEVFLKNDNLIKCPRGTKSMYWKWIKKHGAHDFVKGIISNEEDQEGVTVGRGCFVSFKLLNESTLQDLISIIKRAS